ncbi:MAG: hypothetical protein RIA63_09495, partial [Cyclobacteriaceae bacterium]
DCATPRNKSSLPKSIHLRIEPSAKLRPVNRTTCLPELSVGRRYTPYLIQNLIFKIQNFEF